MKQKIQQIICRRRNVMVFYKQLDDSYIIMLYFMYVSCHFIG
jgi:hypothetical protein